MKTSFSSCMTTCTVWLALLGVPGAACAQATAASQGGNRVAWGGMLGGLAFIVLLAVLWLLLRRTQRLRAAALRSAAATPPQYKPDKVGNDASARPWESLAAPADAAATLSGSTQSWKIPEGFDTAGFLELAKQHYMNVQSAWGRADAEALRALMSAEMFAGAQTQLVDRQARGTKTSVPEVLALQARLLGVERHEGGGCMASVEFSGMAREDVSAGPAPFYEVWNMARHNKVGESSWQVTGIQQISA